MCTPYTHTDRHPAKEVGAQQRLCLSISLMEAVATSRKRMPSNGKLYTSSASPRHLPSINLCVYQRQLEFGTLTVATPRLPLSHRL